MRELKKYRLLVTKLYIKPSGMWRRKQLILPWSAACEAHVLFSRLFRTSLLAHFAPATLEPRTRILKTLSSGIVKLFLPLPGHSWASNVLGQLLLLFQDSTLVSPSQGGLLWQLFLKQSSPITLCRTTSFISSIVLKTIWSYNVITHSSLYILSMR